MPTNTTSPHPDPPTYPDGQGGMVAPPSALPDVLPTERLLASGKPKPPLRDELRRMHNVRNVGNVLSVWIQSFGVIALACWINHPAGWIVAFLLLGRAFALYSILAHEAAHRLLFSKKRWNDLVGKWGLAYPAFVPFDVYRRSHFAHHKEEFGPNEPDLALYNRYPITRASLRRKLTRDAFFNSGWKNLKGLLLAFTSKGARPVAMKIATAQVVIFAGLWLTTGRWWVYPLLWLAPWMSVWRVINRLRSIAEHGGLTMSTDRRLTSHVVHQSWIARFWMVPFNTGWHLAHHVDMGVPFQNLPALHAELVASGWVTDSLEYPTYRSLWRALSSRPAA